MKSAGASFAALAMALAASPVLAESSAAPDAGELLGKAGLDVSIERGAQDTYWTSALAEGVQSFDGRITAVGPDPQVLIADPGTPTTARDPVNINGVGQMVVDAGGGFISLCTGTLINPRTVIFAAHCVNTRTAGDYGANSGGTGIAFGFETNTRANAPGETNELVTWLLGGAGGAGQFQSNVAQAFYNSNYVSYHEKSLEPNARSFLYADVATATLDTPAANVPTWALLFSQLPEVPITAAGTGYHVTITGYGRNGTGSSGSQPIDYRRRIAENTLGALASLNDFESFLFGGTGTSLPQNLYWIDFDDPLRGTPGASIYDFNAWRDNALPNEGMTSNGDSGGPLILDQTFAQSVVIGVLSGGYTRFFDNQPGHGYGTASFFQPLYLYWDWVAANNPFHYVGSIAGNGDWTDPNHWVTKIDPAYQVIVDGQLVNAIPTAPGAGVSDLPGYGQACFESGGVSECLDVASGTVTTVLRPIGTADNNVGQAVVRGTELVDEAASASGAGRPVGGELQAQAEVPVLLPQATLANGLPGATGFVPNNYDGDRVARVAPRYFDVTLGASGVTTLNSAVVIDRFSVADAGAMLDVQSGGSLTSLISITQMTGTMQVNGALATPGDYFMLTGGLNGTGVITTPFFTSTAGTISPGATGNAGSIGTLTFRGNTIFASGTTLMIDLGANGLSDRVAVQSTNAQNGIANVGGRLAFAASGSNVRAGNSYTILTAQNAVTGTFATPAAISAILTPEVFYQTNAVMIQLKAGTYASVVDQAASPVQQSYAALMDANRAGSSGALSGLYDVLDMQSAAGVRAFFESAAPRGESLRTATSVAATGTVDRFLRQRVHTMEPGEATGRLAISGNPLPLAAQGSFVRASAPLESGLGFVDEGQSGGELPDDTSGYLVGGYLEGSSAPMPAAASSGRDSFDGWFMALGFEKAVSDHTSLGFALSYADVDGTTGGAPQEAGSRLIQGTIYGAIASQKDLRLDFRVSAGLLSTESRRNVTLGSTPYSLAMEDDSLSFSAEVGAGFELVRNGPVSVMPRVSMRYETVGFDFANEVGGPMALTVDRNPYEALEGRLGISFAGKSDAKVRPYLEANFVHDFLDPTTSFSAGFVGGTAFAPFALAGTDDNWGEVSGGVTFKLGSSVDISVEADTTMFRDDFRNQSYRGRVSIRF